MNDSDIIDKAYLERIKWHEKGYRNGKFILGAKVVDIMKASNQYVGQSDHFEKRFLGFPYVEDTEDLMAINFCPIKDA